MKSEQTTRRHFLRQSTVAVSAIVAAPYFLQNPKAIAGTEANDRHVIGSVGTGGRWGSIIGGAMRFGDVVAVCDVDSRRAESAKARTGGNAETFQDYRHVLDNNDIDIVIVGLFSWIPTTSAYRLTFDSPFCHGWT